MTGSRLKKVAVYLSAGLALLLLLYGLGRFTHIALDSFITGERGPYLQMVASDSITVRWQTTAPRRQEVRYGPSPGQLERVVRETVPVERHELRLTGLLPDQRYYYGIYQDNQPVHAGEQFWFYTAPPQQTERPVRFWITGDQGLPGDLQRQVRDAALAWVRHNPRPVREGFDLWITTGDNAYPSGSNAQFQAGFFLPYQNLLRTVPVWPAYGNHDARRWVFFQIFSFPQQAEAGGLTSGTEQYYSFDYGPVHVVMLDSQSSDLDPDSPMLRWLQRDLQATTRPWKIAVMHHPPYTKGSHDSDNPRDSGGRMRDIRQNLLPILEQAGVQLVLSGHSHMYERSYLLRCHYGASTTLQDAMRVNPVPEPGVTYRQRGTVYAVVGSSSRLDRGPLNHPAMAVAKHTAGSLIVDIDRQGLQAVMIDQLGQMQDRFTLQNLPAFQQALSCPDNAAR